MSIAKSIAAGITLATLITTIGCNTKTENKATETASTANETLPDSIYTDLLVYLPPVLGDKPTSDTFSILLTTTDLARYDEKKEKKPYVQSIQIIDANEPWPPRWYSSLALVTDEIHQKIKDQGQFMYNFIVDAKVEKDVLAFYKIISKQDVKISPLNKPDISGYILLNQKYEAIDTVTAGGHKRRNLFYHDFRLNDKKERIVDLRKDTYLDLRDYTDDEKDSTVHCYVDYILIVDSNDNTVFTWNPIEHLNPELFRFKETLKEKSMATLRTDISETTRLTSAVFDYDGDIIYSMREIGIGKVSRKDGRLIWQINYTNLPIISGSDTIEWYSPHDINLIAHNATTAYYSIYSDGRKAKPEKGITKKEAEAIIFSMDKKTFEVKLIKKIKPSEKYVARGHGNIDYDFKTGEYMLGYGNLADPDDGPDFRTAMEYGRGDSAQGTYQIPKYNTIYKAHKIQNWPRPPRPVIVRNGDLLEATGEMTDWTWYKLSGSNLTTVARAGKGKTIKPEAGATYCVEGKYGIGLAVSKAFKN